MTRSALCAVLLSCSAALAAAAQSPSTGDGGPLERRIAVHIRDAALRDAIDRVAAVASIRISYSGEVLPLDRRVSLPRDTTTVGEALGTLLRGYPVQAVAIGSDHIVLAPREMPALPDSLIPPPAMLDRVV